MTRTIRVAVANRPRLMRELVRATMADQPDIEIVADIEDEAEIPRMVGETSPEFLIITLDAALDASGARPALCDLLLPRHPQLKILALSSRRDGSVLYRAALEIRATAVETSENEILNVLRANARRGVSASAENERSRSCSERGPE